MKIYKVALLFSLSNSTFLFADKDSAVVNAKAVYNEKCTKCHTSTVYTREDHTITSFSSLKIRVKACAKNAVKEDWNEELVDSVSKYLDHEYYKFPSN